MPVVIGVRDYQGGTTLILQEEEERKISFRFLNDDGTSGRYVGYANFDDFMVTCDLFNKFKEEYMKQNNTNEPRRKIEIPE